MVRASRLVPLITLAIPPALSMQTKPIFFVLDSSAFARGRGRLQVASLCIPTESRNDLKRLKIIR